MPFFLNFTISFSNFTVLSLSKLNVKSSKNTALNPKAVARTVDELENIGEVRIFNINKFKPEDKPYNLTEKQWSAIKIALNEGYYSWPRKVTLEQLACKAEMPMRTYHDLLRRAEAKTMPQLLKTA
ncbi:MAG: hypothetical protein COT15_05235 [Candidatus Diapherotrites archaeon CG08_land_8_20_14_0_20_34_12]|nr:MAG: hypothetical protein COT15_05235 [Candidatus Diapherotrites archaeon CG08_land_8_20_14_0_20_34_12]